MASNTLNDRSAGETIVAAFFNDIHSAIRTDLVGRNSSGVPAASQNLGTASIPWGNIRGNSLIIAGAAVDTSQVAAPPFRVISGKVRTTSNQPVFLDPAGTGNGASVTVLATATSLTFEVNGTAVTLSADIVKSGLSTAPSSNNTALVNDTDAVDQELTRTWGEIDGERKIVIDAVGSEITTLVGTVQAFKINDGTNDEYFLAYIDSATSLSMCYRGFFYGSTEDPINRLKFFNNDTMTLMRAHYVFADSDGSTIDTSTTAPAYNATAPSGPATGDYWFDLSSGNNLWKRFDGVVFQTVNRTLIGIAVMDDTDCIAARCVDFDTTYKTDNTIEVRKDTDGILESNSLKQYITVAGNRFFYDVDLPIWNMAGDLAGSADMYNASEQASTRYYFYISDEGEEIISDISPYFRPDFLGYYHPHNPWRCVAFSDNDGSSNLGNPSSWACLVDEIILDTGNGHGGTNTKIRRFTTVEKQSGGAIKYESAGESTDGASFTILKSGWYTVTYVDRATAANTDIGISRNSTELTTNIVSIASADRLSRIQNSTGLGADTSATFYADVGDVIRPHTNGVPDDATDLVKFQIMRVGGWVK